MICFPAGIDGSPVWAEGSWSQDKFRGTWHCGSQPHHVSGCWEGWHSARLSGRQDSAILAAPPSFLLMDSFSQLLSHLLQARPYAYIEAPRGCGLNSPVHFHRRSLWRDPRLCCLHCSSGNCGPANQQPKPDQQLEDQNPCLTTAQRRTDLTT